MLKSTTKDWIVRISIVIIISTKGNFVLCILLVPNLSSLWILLNRPFSTWFWLEWGRFFFSFLSLSSLLIMPAWPTLFCWKVQKESHEKKTSWMGLVRPGLNCRHSKWFPLQTSFVSLMKAERLSWEEQRRKVIFPQWTFYIMVLCQLINGLCVEKQNEIDFGCVYINC